MVDVGLLFGVVWNGVLRAVGECLDNIRGAAVARGIITCGVGLLVSLSAECVDRTVIVKVLHATCCDFTLPQKREMLFFKGRYPRFPAWKPAGSSQSESNDDKEHLCTWLLFVRMLFNAGIIDSEALSEMRQVIVKAWEVSEVRAFMGMGGVISGMEVSEVRAFCGCGHGMGGCFMIIYKRQYVTSLCL